MPFAPSWRCVTLARHWMRSHASAWERKMNNILKVF
jgi:hypothetical protein